MSYCRGVQNDQRMRTEFTRDGQARAGHMDRYRVLNVTNLAGGKATVEFRVFAGTTNPTKAIACVRLAVGLVEKALKMKRSPKWTAKTPVETSPIHRSGEGQTALTRLF